jgi:hypothetical protein
MTINTANWDRALRLLLGICLVAMAFVGPQTPLGWAGLILAATAAVGFCPIYRLFGISTCAVKKASPR